MRVPIPKAAMTALALLGAGVASSYAGTFSHNFDTDPTADLVLRGNAAWRPSGGQGDPAASGYLSITDALNGQSGKIVFDDFDNGKIVAGFTFDVDLRTGGGTGSPADGYSVNYARTGDGSLDNDGNPDGNDWASSPTGEGNLPEEGVKNGLALCLDEWFSGGTDVIGITVRVDNAIIFNKAYPTANGALGDLSSLQTGPAGRPRNPDDGSAGVPFDVPDLGWAHLSAVVDTDGTVDVSYKGEKILDNFVTPYGPSSGRIVFAGRTGGANAHHHADNLVIVTTPAEKFVVGGASGGANKYRVTLTDSVATGSIVDPATATFALDGVAVTPVSVVKTDENTVFSFELPAGTYFASGSVHNLQVNAKDTNGADGAGLRQFTVINYSNVPPSLSSGLDVASLTPGWMARTVWEDGNRRPGDVNRTVNAERQLARGYLDTDGAPIVNKADAAAVVDGRTAHVAGNVFTIDGVVNFDQASAAQGNFRAANGYPEITFPGIPSGDQNNMTIEVSGYVMFPVGLHTLVVNSDDGFRFSIGRGLSDYFGRTFSEFDGGRGASDTVFNILVTEAGLYPVRVLWWEGGGGANLEIFSITEDGVRHLLNDETDPASLMVYRGAPAKSHVVTAMPVHRQFGGQQSESPLIVEVADGASPVGDIVLTVDGVVQTPSVVKEGNVTTLRVDYPAGQVPGHHFAKVAFDGQEFSWDFNISRLQKSAGNGNFVIEAEDMNNNGTFPPEVNTMPYAGGALNGADSVKHLDFFNNDGNDANNYRAENAGGDNDINMDNGHNGDGNSVRADNSGKQNERGSWDATTNFKIGWIGDGDYGVYTRTVPAGKYLVVASQSFDSPDNNLLRGSLFVGSTPAMSDASKLGTFNQHGTRGWGINNHVLLRDSGGNVAVVTMDGTEKSFRWHYDSGDADYLAFVPIGDAGGGAPVLGPVVLTVPPGATARGALNFSIGNRGTSVDIATIALKVDGANAAVTTSASANGANVKHTPGADYGAVGSSHTYELTYKDNTGASYAKSGSFNVVGGSFFIEAEDFNYGGGNTVAAASVMPYTGGAYQGLGAINGIDIDNRDGFDSNVYRIGEVLADGITPANVNLNGNDTGFGKDFRIRDGWSVTSNWKMGWVGGDWGNYTRDFPANTYEVWAALSFDGGSPDQLSADLHMVTSDPTQPGQTTELLGRFRAPGSGGWGNNALVQLKDADGNPAILSLGGVATIRMHQNSGDFDYLQFRPAKSFRFSSIVKNANGTITVSWTGGGTLQAAPELTGPWTDVPGATSPFTFVPDQARLFGRIRE